MRNMCEIALGKTVISAQSESVKCVKFLSLSAKQLLKTNRRTRTYLHSIGHLVQNRFLPAEGTSNACQCGLNTRCQKFQSTGTQALTKPNILAVKSLKWAFGLSLHCSLSIFLYTWQRLCINTCSLHDPGVTTLSSSARDSVP